MAPLHELERLLDTLGSNPEPDALAEAFASWSSAQGRPLYPHQEEALLATLAGNNTIITTPTGSGKSLIATAAHVATLAKRGRVYYTAPIKALVSEKFFDWTDMFGPDLVGMVTGDASVNPHAPIICCTAEILANIALREGSEADVDMVIADEYHFIADPDRGWAWLVATLELPQAQFMLMSATLGDVSDLADQLTLTTKRETTVIADAPRPVPLVFSYSTTPLHETLAELVATGQTPVYLVYPSQAAATRAAQGFTSSKFVTTEQRRAIVEAIGEFRFAKGFGQTLAKLLRAGVGVHHAGLLPKYRRLVEMLAQKGLLTVICGTDTLGVGINVPIRTVVFSTLVKFDGRRDRVLRSREFHQIAGRAGRPGFDPVGNVIAQAPEYEIENARVLAKHAGNEKKLRSVRLKKPERGEVSYNKETFERLVDSTPETLYGRLAINHATIINLLHRDESMSAAVSSLVKASTDNPGQQKRLMNRAIELTASLLEAGVITQREKPAAGGREYELSDELQDDFALNQPLSAFAMSMIADLDPEREEYELDVISVIEATLEDPQTILYAQQRFERGEVIAELKADGYDYFERQQIAEEVTWPQPMADEMDEVFSEFAASHPWLTEQPLRPKSIVRDMIERAMTFAEYVAFYKIQRSEGLLLRYLTDAWRSLRQTVPTSARTEMLDEWTLWLGEMLRSVDSSLVDEWEALAEGTPTREPSAEVEPPSRGITDNLRAFRVLVRNAMFRRIQLAAVDDVEGLAAMDADDPDLEFDIDDWDDALGDYWEEHDEIGTGASARAPRFFVVDDTDPRFWFVTQVVEDPDRNYDWRITAEVDLDASDGAGELRLHVVEFGRIDS